MTGRYMLYAGTALALGLSAATAQTTAEMDTDGDGNISTEEVLSYGAQEPEGENTFSGIYDFDIVGGVTAEEYAQLERGRLDADADGTIDEEEFAAWMEATGGYAAAAAVDTGATEEAPPGSVSEQETAADEVPVTDRFDARVQELYELLDADGDGELSQEEFLRAELSRFDADGDGVLDDDEAAGLEEFLSGSGSTTE